MCRSVHNCRHHIIINKLLHLLLDNLVNKHIGFRNLVMLSYNMESHKLKDFILEYFNKNNDDLALIARNIIIKYERSKQINSYNKSIKIRKVTNLFLI
jgi:hypothetical protein